MSLYREEILEHYKDPQNFGELPDADIVIEEDNPLCGDRQKWYIKFTENTKTQKPAISEVSFMGDGCAISTAAASILSEEVKNKPTEDVLAMDQHDIAALLGVDVAPARVKCIMLPLVAIQKGACKYIGAHE